MKSEFKEGMYVEVLSRKGLVLGANRIYVEGQPIGKIIKVYRDTKSKYKYKVRIAPRTYVYCKENELRDFKIEK